MSVNLRIFYRPGTIAPMYSKKAY